MTQNLVSFHSSKGGTGKSTLAAGVACAWAAAEPTRPVYLLDLDLQGTGLSGCSSLQAPVWRGTPDLCCSPERYVAGRPDDDNTCFIDDFLLYVARDRDQQYDARPDMMAWPWKGAPGDVRVLPARCTPQSIGLIEPVIADEGHGAFLESRLEWLLDALFRVHADVCVVIDTGPGMHVLSRAVMSLCVRLGGSPKISLSDDGGMPLALERADVRSRAFLVTTPDVSALRPTQRWAQLALPSEYLDVVTNHVVSDRRTRHVRCNLNVPYDKVLHDIFNADTSTTVSPSLLTLLGLNEENATNKEL